jgi:RimJ/RimL family protein N-acetyltransferase
MQEQQTAKQPIHLETNQPGLTLLEMTTIQDDEAYFDLQNANLDYWKEFGNSIDPSVEEVTIRRTMRDGPRFGIYKDGLLIGIQGYMESPDGKQAEVGILMSQESGGHGYATSAVKALTEYIKPQYERVFAEIKPDNSRSIKLFENTGYTRVGDEIERPWGRALVYEYRQQA